MSNAHSADLSEIEAYVDDLETRLSAARAGYVDNINNANLATISDISNLSATEIAYLDAKVSEVIKQVALTGHPAGSIGKILYDYYNTRLTSARCGYLDNINNSNLSTIADISTLTATQIAHLDADISTAGGSPLSMIDIWGTPLTTGVAITNAAADKTLGDVVIPNLGTYTIVKAYAMFHVASLLETSAAQNWTNTDTFVQVDKAAAGYINAISMPDVCLCSESSLRQIVNAVFVGNLDISSRVANNATTNFKWLQAVATADGMTILGAKSGVRLIVS